VTERVLIGTIGSIAFCDNGALISGTDIGAALDADRAAGFQDPTLDEVSLLIQGDANGKPPSRLIAEHPALSALLTKEMT